MVGSRTRRAARGATAAGEVRDEPGAQSSRSYVTGPGRVSGLPEKMGSHRRGRSRGATRCDLCARVTQAAALRLGAGVGGGEGGSKSGQEVTVTLGHVGGAWGTRSS